ncbi:MAG: hypothetical protein M3Q14_03520, partial [bacterium]|nr:hypothetical protein [bacterium]
HHNREWIDLYKDRENCVLASPSASSLASALNEVLKDTVLRKKIISAGRITARSYTRSEYVKQAKLAIKTIKSSKKA